jgi:hypothetical protein
MHCCAWGGLGSRRWHGVITYEHVSFVCSAIPYDIVLTCMQAHNCYSLICSPVSYIPHFELDFYNSTFSFVFDLGLMFVEGSVTCSYHNTDCIGILFREMFHDSCVNTLWQTHGTHMGHR